MKDFPSENKAMKKSMEIDRHWREREARLTEVTANRLNQINSNKFSQEYEKYPSKMYEQLYEKPKYESPIKTASYRPEHRIASDYSVSSIDKIQQRIQSILRK